jgi:hypothetical protein
LSVIDRHAGAVDGPQKIRVAHRSWIHQINGASQQALERVGQAEPPMASGTVGLIIQFNQKIIVTGLGIEARPSRRPE